MIDTRLIGPKDDQYAVLSLGTVWLATTKKPYAEAVSAAVAAAIAGGGATDALPSEMGTIPSDPAAATPITDAIVRVMQAGWLSLGSSAPGAVRPLVEALEVFERENADLKQRLLPQFAGRAQKAEHERDALLEQLVVAEKRVAAIREGSAPIAKESA